MDVDHEHQPAKVRYLGLAWLRELSREVAEHPVLAALATEHSIAVTQVVTDGPEGDVTYHLVVRDGSASFGAGPADDEDVRIRQSWDTSVAVTTGTLNAAEAFLSGRILMFGDRQKLLDAQPVFAALDQVFRTVQERTDYE